MNVLKNAGAIAIFLFALAFLTFRMTGHTALVITGGSMEPTIHKGSVVLVQATTPEHVSLCDVITFVFYGQTTTHRVIAIDDTAQGPAFTTKGDANVAADPEAKLFAAQVGIVRASVPLLGYALVYAQSYAWIVLAIAAGAVFIVSLVQVVRALRAPKPAPRGSRA